MSNNLTPTPYLAGWRHATAVMEDTAEWPSDRYDPPAAFKAEYAQGWGDALDAWDIDHGAAMVPEDEMTDAQRAGMARKRAVLGADWPTRGGQTP